LSRNLKQMGLSEKIRLQIRSFLVILVILLLVLAIILIIRAAFLLKTSEPNILFYSKIFPKQVILNQVTFGEKTSLKKYIKRQ